MNMFERYSPSPEELKKAEGMMNEPEKKSTEIREGHKRKLAEMGKEGLVYLMKKAPFRNSIGRSSWGKEAWKSGESEEMRGVINGIGFGVEKKLVDTGEIVYGGRIRVGDDSGSLDKEKAEEIFKKYEEIALKAEDMDALEELKKEAAKARLEIGYEEGIKQLL
jgi:hypothetical protein